jgi:ATP-dependent DNA helicase RecG
MQTICAFANEPGLGGGFLLLGEEQLEWLQQFSHLELTDEEAKALILAKETGAVDNAALRAITSLDTLAVSQLLRKLTVQLKLLKKVEQVQQHIIV